MRNVVFIPNIDLGDGRNKSYSYSINSWKHFCDLSLIWGAKVGDSFQVHVFDDPGMELRPECGGCMC